MHHLKKVKYIKMWQYSICNLHRPVFPSPLHNFKTSRRMHANRKSYLRESLQKSYRRNLILTATVTIDTFQVDLKFVLSKIQNEVNLWTVGLSNCNVQSNPF